MPTNATASAMCDMGKRVVIKTLTGQTHECHLPLDSTVGDLKRHLRAKAPDLGKCTLFHKGTRLLNKITMEELQCHDSEFLV